MRRTALAFRHQQPRAFPLHRHFRTTAPAASAARPQATTRTDRAAAASTAASALEEQFPADGPTKKLGKIPDFVPVPAEPPPPHVTQPSSSSSCASRASSAPSSPRTARLVLKRTTSNCIRDNSEYKKLHENCMELDLSKYNHVRIDVSKKTAVVGSSVSMEIVWSG